MFSVAYQQTSDEKDLEYAFFGMFDGHGGREAAQYSKVCISTRIEVGPKIEQTINEIVYQETLHY